MKHIILVLTALIIIVTLTESCKKNTATTTSTPTGTGNVGPGTTTTNVTFPDTSKTGVYVMVSCDPTSEQANIALRLAYRSHRKSEADTTKTFVLYNIMSNTGEPGQVRFSKNYVFKNQNSPGSQPYIETLDSKVTAGINGSSDIVLGGNNRFSGDTLYLNLSVNPYPTLLRCAYKKL